MRLLLAQALQHDLKVATVDPEIASYPVSLLPAIKAVVNEPPADLSS